MLERLLEVITPRPAGGDCFSGENMHPQGFRVYGGQVLAQAANAAQATVDPERVLHSLHAYFLRPGDTGQPITLEVERARDGGSFNSRRVVAQQRGKPILVSSLSFQTPCDGLSFQADMPVVPPPESLISERQRALDEGHLDEDFMITTGEDIDMRMVEPIDWFNPVQQQGLLHAWMRSNGPMPDDPNLHRAMLVYFSDCLLLDAGLIQHGLAYQDRRLQIASLDHALWFHDSFRADEWLLQVTELERNSAGRSLVRGRFFTRDGVHVATLMQQGLIRFR